MARLLLPVILFSSLVSNRAFAKQMTSQTNPNKTRFVFMFAGPSR